MQRFQHTLDEDISHKSGMNMHYVCKYINITYRKRNLETEFLNKGKYCGGQGIAYAIA